MHFKQSYLNQTNLPLLIEPLAALIPQFNNFTWMYKFNSSKQSIVESKLKTLRYQYHWIEVTEYMLPAYRVHPVTKKEVWSNQSNYLNAHNNINPFFKKILKDPNAQSLFLKPGQKPFIDYFGYGETITIEESQLIQDAIHKNTIVTIWQPGDFKVLDNYGCLHGKTQHIGNWLVLLILSKYDFMGDK